MAPYSISGCSPPREYNCCTREFPCDEGEGDCNSVGDHEDCKDGLECGSDNCRTMNGYDSSIPSALDCCRKIGYGK